MRNISFQLTVDAIRNQTKTVTRRLGWKNLKPGELLQACAKCQGLKKGQHPEKLCVIRVVKVSQEPLRRIAFPDPVYGVAEVLNEGFPQKTPPEFVEMFCEHNGCTPETVVTRIEFEYVDPLNPTGAKHDGSYDAI